MATKPKSTTLRAKKHAELRKSAQRAKKHAELRKSAGHVKVSASVWTLEADADKARAAMRKAAKKYAQPNPAGSI